MSYSFNLLTLDSEVDTLLSGAQREKRTLEVRKQSITLRTDNSVEDSVGLAADLASAKASLDSTNSIIATLPEGERKEDEITKKLDLELKIRKMTRSSNKLSPVSIIENEYDIDQLDRQLAGIDAYITALNARKLELRR